MAAREKAPDGAEPLIIPERRRTYQQGQQARRQARERPCERTPPTTNSPAIGQTCPILGIDRPASGVT